jgi:hypothetical protein
MESSEQHMQKRAKEKQEALDRLLKVISAIEAAGREPDRWERVCLVLGISCIFSGLYELAKTEAHVAATPAEERSPKSNLPLEAVYDCTLVLLKRALQEAQNAPVEPFQRFGSIQFAADA